MKVCDWEENLKRKERREDHRDKGIIKRWIPETMYLLHSFVFIPVLRYQGRFDVFPVTNNLTLIQTM